MSSAQLLSSFHFQDEINKGIPFTPGSYVAFSLPVNASASSFSGDVGTAAYYNMSQTNSSASFQINCDFDCDGDPESITDQFDGGSIGHALPPVNGIQMTVTQPFYFDFTGAGPIVYGEMWQQGAFDQMTQQYAYTVLFNQNNGNEVDGYMPAGVYQFSYLMIPTWDYSGPGFEVEPSSIDLELSTSPIPEPTSLSIMGIGLVGLLRRKTVQRERAMERV